jgi:hypothetical protein
MNELSDRFLDRKETLYAEKIDSAGANTGFKRIEIKVYVKSQRVDFVRVYFTRNAKADSSDIQVGNRAGTFGTIINDMPEFEYLFSLVSFDKYGNRSLPYELSGKVVGDNYQSMLRDRPISVVTKFGNGYAIGLGATSSLYSELLYRNTDGVSVTKKISTQDPAVYLYDYDGSGFSQITYYLPDSTAVDTLRLETSYTGQVNDRVTVITSSTVTYAKPGDFDLGGEGVGFHDSNTGHDPGSGGADYRPNLGDYLSAAMDIEGDGGNIGYTGDGEWLMYTVDVRDEGDYEIDWYVSVNGSGAACHVEVDGNSSEVYQMVDNYNWSDWRYYCERNDVAPPKYHLTAGKHTVKYVWNGGSFNYNGLRFTPKP